MFAEKENDKEKIYEFKNSQHPYLKYLYQKKYSGNNISYNEFISQHPVFFWQDGFGRWIKFKDKKFIPELECGS